MNNTEPIITTVAYSKSTRKTHVDVRGKVNGESNTLSTGDGCSNMSTQNFVGVSFNRLEGVRKEIDTAHTLSSSDWRGLNRNQEQTAVFDPDTIRIRKLTPVEGERLQGYPDLWTQYGRKPDGTVYLMSNSQRYRQIGNGVSSPKSKKIIETLVPKGARILSLFSGIGGTELLLDSRYTVVGHCEFDKYASDVLHYNYPHIPNFGDVTKLVDRTDVPEFDMLVGGFPCQSWSSSGLRKGFDEDRGQLIYHVFDILKKYKPKHLLLENVKGLLTHNKGDSFEAIMEFLSSLGYELDFELVNSKDFNLAQNRQRVFIYGKLKT